MRFFCAFYLTLAAFFALSVGCDSYLTDDQDLHERRNNTPVRGGPPISYSIQAPGPEQSEVKAVSVNNPGQVLLFDENSGSYLWNERAGLQFIGDFRAVDMNDRGQVTGTHRDGAFVWERGDLTLLIPEIGSSEAVAISNSGAVIGYYWDDARQEPFIWTRQGGFRHLPIPCDEPRLSDINAGGQITGSCLNESSEREAIVWSARHGLAWLGDAPSTATAINNGGQVTGMGQSGPFLWTRQRGRVNMARDGYDHLRLRDINERGEIVGTYRAAAPEFPVSSQDRPFIMLKSGEILDLPGLSVGAEIFGDHTGEALAISNNGVAVGFAYLEDDEGMFSYRAAVWTPQRGQIAMIP